MAELYGLSLTQHLDNILEEAKHHKTIYGYPLKKVFKPDPSKDLSVVFHKRKAATPLGPASGPHTQMAQNILLSFLGGGRIMELKTVQILDRLEIPRPCIDMRNIGFNVEWSQELRLDESYHEYVVAWVLLKIIEEMELLDIPKGDPFYNTIFDLSVGYDLKGISSPAVTNWITRMMKAGPYIDRLLKDLPPRYAAYRNLSVNPRISNSLTLSTFHGCPRNEIQSIVEYLIGGLGLNVLIKMNPTQAGYHFVEKTLNQDLGYKHIQLDLKSFQDDMQFKEAVSMMKDLEVFARALERNVGAKFTNTLVVNNKDNVFTDSVMYLSGPPLHVISMNAMLNFRKQVGAHIPISFSAGVDSENFVDTVLCGMVPVTSCSDLLGKGGYTRMVNYLRKLEKAMDKSGCKTIESFVNQTSGGAPGVVGGVQNAMEIVPRLIENPKYHYKANSKLPKKVGSKLEFFDCLTCNICLPVCPNASNFSLPVGKSSSKIHHFKWDGNSFTPGEAIVFNLDKPAQIANYADFCNECGNCDTFCPEDGGPYIVKPRFFSTKKTWEKSPRLDGFYFEKPHIMVGRMDGRLYRLEVEDALGISHFTTPEAVFKLNQSHEVIEGESLGLEPGDVVDMLPYHRMLSLLKGFEQSHDYAAKLLRESFH